jgi:hypothetical protein
MLDFRSGEGMLMKYKKRGMQGAVGTKDNLVTMVTVKNQSQFYIYYPDPKMDDSLPDKTGK